METIKKPLFIISLIALLLAGCGRETDMDVYSRLARSELKSGKRVDSIFFGIYLGMPRKQFYVHCWELNKGGILTDGMNNNFVLYKLHRQELNHPASMNFYPDFNDSTIWKMRINFQYDGWGPWTKHMSADSLLPDVVQLFKRWYPAGNAFIEINDKTRGKLFAKVDGNRRITVTKLDDVIVKAEVTDMIAEKQRLGK